MKLVEINWNPPERQLRQFGLIALFCLPLATWLLAGRPAPSDWTTTFWRVFGALSGLGLLLALLGLLRPRALRPVFVGLSLVTFPIGLAISQLVLAVIFFGMFLPVALLFRLAGRDALHRRFDRSATSYWERKSRPGEASRYFRQS